MAAAGKAKSPTNFGVVSGATHKVLKPLAQFMPAPAPAAAAAKKKPTNNKPTAWVQLKGGKPEDELKFSAKAVLDEDDPNFDPADAQPPPDFDDAEAGAEAGAEEEDYEPATADAESQKQFVASIGDLDKFKAAVKAATDEYLASADALEFVQSVKELRLPIYHQELAHIVIKHTLDKRDDERRKVTGLLVHAFKQLLVTENQLLLGFTKLYNQLDDLQVDSPSARKVVAEHASRAVDFGILNAQSVKALADADAALHSDAKAVSALKAKVKAAVREYLSGGDRAEAATALVELKAPAFHFEFVKTLISSALDATDAQRELASALLASVTGDVVEQAQVVKAFEILLQRVEDLYLDVRNVLHLLSCFLARAVVDECVPPAFLLRQDLAVSDMGLRVVKAASDLLSGKGVAKRLENVWKPELKPKTGRSAMAAAVAATAAAPAIPVPQVAGGSTGTAKIVEGAGGKKKAVLSLAPLPKGGAAAAPAAPATDAKAKAADAKAKTNAASPAAAGAGAGAAAAAAGSTSPTAKPAAAAGAGPKSPAAKVDFAAAAKKGAAKK